MTEAELLGMKVRKTPVPLTSVPSLLFCNPWHTVVIHGAHGIFGAVSSDRMPLKWIGSLESGVFSWVGEQHCFWLPSSWVEVRTSDGQEQWNSLLPSLLGNFYQHIQVVAFSGMDWE